MIELVGPPAPVTAVCILLEECGLAYCLQPPPPGTGAAFRFGEDRPPDGGHGVLLSSPALALQYLAESRRRFLPLSWRRRFQVLNWLARSRLDLPLNDARIKRKAAQADQVLMRQRWLTEYYSIADMAWFALWHIAIRGQQDHGLSALTRWYERLASRPAISAVLKKTAGGTGLR